MTVIVKKLLRILVSVSALIFSANTFAIPVAGVSSGTFINPTGPGGMVTTGAGTDSFTWGDGTPFFSPPSSLQYTGNTFSVQTDDVFSFGTLQYFNGTIALGTQADAVDLDVLLSLTTPSGINQDFLYNLGLINTLNTSDPNASADIVNLPSAQPDTFFTVDGIDYTLEFLGFGSITGSGFTTVDNFSVFEGSSASAEMLGRITVATSVPEPGTLMLMSLGIIGIALKGKGKRRGASNHC